MDDEKKFIRIVCGLSARRLVAQYPTMAAQTDTIVDSLVSNTEIKLYRNPMHAVAEEMVESIMGRPASPGREVERLLADGRRRSVVMRAIYEAEDDYNLFLRDVDKMKDLPLDDLPAYAANIGTRHIHRDVLREQRARRVATRRGTAVGILLTVVALTVIVGLDLGFRVGVAAVLAIVLGCWWAVRTSSRF